MRPLRFRAVALIAAYAVALHTLLLAFATIAPAAAASHFAGLCSGLSTDQNNAPIDGRDTSCALACLSLGPSVGPLPQAAVAIEAIEAVLVPRVITARVPSSAMLEGPHRARAPPSV